MNKISNEYKQAFDNKIQNMQKFGGGCSISIPNDVKDDIIRNALLMRIIDLSSQTVEFWDAYEISAETAINETSCNKKLKTQLQQTQAKIKELESFNANLTNLLVSYGYNGENTVEWLDDKLDTYPLHNKIKELEEELNVLKKTEYDWAGTYGPYSDVITIALEQDYEPKKHGNLSIWMGDQLKAKQPPEGSFQWASDLYKAGERPFRKFGEHKAYFEDSWTGRPIDLADSTDWQVERREAICTSCKYYHTNLYNDPLCTFKGNEYENICNPNIFTCCNYEESDGQND